MISIRSTHSAKLPPALKPEACVGVWVSWPLRTSVPFSFTRSALGRDLSHSFQSLDRWLREEHRRTAHIETSSRATALWAQGERLFSSCKKHAETKLETRDG